MTKKKKFKENFLRNIPLLLMALPGIVYIFVLRYIPIYGIIIAFKDFRIHKNGFLYSLMTSKWVGFKNFEFLFKTQDAKIIFRNTIGYSLLFLFLGMIFQIIVALLLLEMTNRRTVKVYQTLIIFPHFLSMVIVAFFVYVFLAPNEGVINNMLMAMGFQKIEWYMEPKYWPYILTIVTLWKGTGYGSIMYLATITGFDQELYEAAVIDGATKWQQTTNITLPLLKPIISIMLILGLSNVLGADFGLFYQVPRNIPMLNPATNVIPTFVYRALMNMGNIVMPAAAGLLQSVAGFILIIVANTVVRMINPENSLF
ncbi:MAG TPA: sugar ABC transporter permease [Clostridiales bacterium]|nr:sugar ABC transporter permease [Clostridiales bacterium]